MGEFSILTAEQRVDDLSAAHGRSIRWLNVCVRSAVLLWSVYMSMGRLLGCVLCVVMERLQLLGWRHHILDVGKFSILTAKRRMDDLSAAHGRSIRWLKACVRSAVLLWSVYMIMGRLLSFVVEWRIMYFDVRMIYVVSFVFSTYCLQMSNLRRWWQFVTYICLVVCNKLYYDVNFWIWMSINMHVFTLLFCFSLLPLTCSSICTNLKVLVQYKFTVQIPVNLISFSKFPGEATSYIQKEMLT